jgi:isocitrate dehydrogenase (NAD+)
MTKLHDVVLIAGDGIGPEVTAAVRRILEKAEAPLRYIEHQAGERALALGHSELLPQETLDAIRDTHLALKGPISTPIGGGFRSVNVALRKALNLYAAVRPVRSMPGVKTRFENVDLVIVRENTEGLYSGIGERTADRATDLRVITRRASERVIRAAFELSRRREKGAPGDGKRRVTCIVKHNVLAGCRLFLEVFREVATHYPDIEPDVAIVDSFAMFVLTQPERYDVCVTTNMFGDIVTDLASVLQGGMGMAVGCNVGDDHAMFEPIHGSAPPLAGKDRANPMAMMLATGEAMAWLGRRFADDRLLRAHQAIEAAVATLVARGEPLTTDLGGSAPQSIVAQAVRDEVRRTLDP